MKRILRCLTMMVAVAVIFTTCSVAFAKNKYIDLSDSANYAITVSQNELTVSSNLASPKTYALGAQDVTFTVESPGLVLSFFTSGGNDKKITMGRAVKTLTVFGELNSLNISDTLDYSYTVNLDAVVKTLVLNGAASLALSERAVVDSLSVNNDKSKVVLTAGAQVGNSNYVPDSTTYLDFAARSYKTATTSVIYDENSRNLSLTAKAEGCTVQDALSDVLMLVRQVNNNNAVSGKWYWPYLDGSSTQSGRYIYRFAPTRSEYQSIELIIDFTAYDE